MKNLIIAIFLLSSSLTFACADLRHKPGYFTQKEIHCGAIVNRIIEPKIIVSGTAYPIAIDMGDMYGECPDPNVGCYRPAINIERRGNAICRAYGLGPYAKSSSYSPLFHTDPDIMVRLKRTQPHLFAPQIVRINHSRSEYFEVREVWCHKTYPKR